MAEHSWDTLITNALIFDGTGAPPQTFDIAIKDGRIAAKGNALPAREAAEVIDADGQWLMPGLLDIHTHLDLEVDLDPRLPEVVRHGTTTVLFGNCSLGTSFGSQVEDGQNPIVDCFTRVENIPKRVLQKCVETVTWSDTGDYLDHFDDIPLGPNVAAFLPHSMLRIEVMGLQDSISREPTEAELTEMEKLLSKAMDEGYIGMSTDGLPFHYLANDPNTDKRIPTQFATRKEMTRLLKILRDRDRVWQTTPILENRLKALAYFFFSSGRLFGKTLKTSALSVVEFVLMPKANASFLNLAKLINSKLFRGNIHFQALGTNFRIWSDGVVSPLYEEMETTCKLIAKEYDDIEGRLALLNDPKFIEQFREEWYEGRRGYNLSHLRSKLGLPDNLVIRDIELMIFDGAPVPDWEGESMQTVYKRLEAFQAGNTLMARSDAEREAFEQFPDPVTDDCEFFLHLLRAYDKDVRFWVDVANVGNKATLDLLLHEGALPGFNDSGAHITNMAFFDANLSSLRLAALDSMETLSRMVQRLTSEPAKFFGLDVGTLEIGAVADITIIYPDALKKHDCDAGRKFVHRELFDHEQLVNRSDGVVSRVLIKGETVWNGNDFTPVLGSKPLGRALRAA